MNNAATATNPAWEAFCSAEETRCAATRKRREVEAARAALGSFTLFVKTLFASDLCPSNDFKACAIFQGLANDCLGY